MAGRDAQRRRDLMFEDVPAPKRLAPYATAIAATVQRDDADVAWGRLVLLYDPDGQQGWEGFFRLVAYVRADVEPEMAADPMLGEVGWSWLSEALDMHVPGYAVPSGTVTRVITEGFGAKRDELPLTGFELRASWSPVGPDGPRGSAGLSDLDTLDLSAHIAAWCDCMSAAAGLEPPGTRALRQPGYGRAQTRSGRAAACPTRALRQALSGRAAACPTRALRQALSGRAAACPTRALRQALRLAGSSHCSIPATAYRRSSRRTRPWPRRPPG
jgi:hypothetical protein